MFPAAFDYRAPASLDEALAILKERGDEAKVLAGGQSLIPLLKLRFSRPELVVDIARIGGLNAIKRDDGHLVIGALARHVDIERSEEVGAATHLLDAAAGDERDERQRRDALRFQCPAKRVRQIGRTAEDVPDLVEDIDPARDHIRGPLDAPVTLSQPAAFSFRSDQR